ncbi:MAG: hypothetical protein HY835_06045 [Anaerolineae bacterium]|nr:hypothetical protein [Anaerolineae bacterium]
MEELCALMVEMQASYVENQNGVGACEVLFHLKEIARQNNLPHLVAFAETTFQVVAKKTMGLPKQKIVPVTDLLERYMDYFCPR